MAAFGGFVHVSYRTRLRATGLFDTVRLEETTASEADLAFGPEVQLGPDGDLAFAARSGSDRFLGDYMGLVADADSVHAAWCVPGASDPGTLHQTAWSGAVLR